MFFDHTKKNKSKAKKKQLLDDDISYDKPVIVYFLFNVTDTGISYEFFIT